MRHIHLLAALMLALLSWGEGVKAQQRVPSYRPATPPLSPYLYLTRPNFGFLPNYQTYVEPLNSQTQVNQIQQTEIARLQQQLRQQQTQYSPARIAPTGTGSVYNDLLHYYPGNQPTAARGPAPRR